MTQAASSLKRPSPAQVISCSIYIAGVRTPVGFHLSMPQPLPRPQASVVQEGMLAGISDPGLQTHPPVRGC